MERVIPGDAAFVGSARTSWKAYAGVLASLQDALAGGCCPVVSLRSTTGLKLRCLRHLIAPGRRHLRHLITLGRRHLRHLITPGR